MIATLTPIETNEDYDARITRISQFDPFYQGSLWEEDEPVDPEPVAEVPAIEPKAEQFGEYEVLVARVSPCDPFYGALLWEQEEYPSLYPAGE
jgi:hypothetical protein